MQPRVSKQILGNIIKHIDNHNRIKEEEECWRQHLNTKVSEISKSNPRMMYKGRTRNIEGICGKAHMDDEEGTRQCVYVGREATTNYWMRQFDILESSMSHRWGHNGFKELHPELFRETSNDSKRLNDHYKEESKSESDDFQSTEKKRKLGGGCQKEHKGKKHKEVAKLKQEDLNDFPKHKFKNHYGIEKNKNIKLENIGQAENSGIKTKEHKHKKHKHKRHKYKDIKSDKELNKKETSPSSTKHKKHRCKKYRHKCIEKSKSSSASCSPKLKIKHERRTVFIHAEI